MTHLPVLYHPRLDLPGLSVVLMQVAALKPNGRNARTHTGAQIDKLAAAILTFGFTAPIIIGTANMVLAGHARLTAAIQAGLSEVPTISLAHLTPEQQRAYMLADNKLASLASWDEDILSAELTDLAGFDLGISFGDMGFSTAELDLLLADDVAAGEIEPPVPEVAKVAVTRLADVWVLGSHRLICGDSLDPATFDILMPGEQARMIFADAPYNVPIVGHVAKRDSDAREFAMGVGEMTIQEFTDFLKNTLGNAAARSGDGAIAYVCMDWRHIPEVMMAGAQAVGMLKNLVVWAKPNAGMGAFYRSQHELIFVFKKGVAEHVNNFGLGKDRYRTNVWKYAGASGFHADRDHDIALHPTTKPVAMVADAIMDVSHRGDVVLDPFGGSGSTLMAAEQTGRVARLVEIDPLYCDVIARRFIADGGEVCLEATGQTFAEVEADRAIQQGEAA